MKRILWLISGIIILGILVFLDVYIKKSDPSFLIEQVNEYKENETLIKKLGGYKSFEYKYNQNQLEEDTLDFQIVLYGENKSLFLIGKAIKENNNSWKIVERNESIQ